MAVAAGVQNIPQELQNLIDADWDLELLIEENLQQEHLDRLDDLFEIAYRAYLSGDSQERIPCQDTWMPKFWDFRQHIEQVPEAAQYLVKLETWAVAHQAYRDWIRHSHLSHEQLIAMWESLGDEE